MGTSILQFSFRFDKNDTKHIKEGSNQYASKTKDSGSSNGQTRKHSPPPIPRSVPTEEVTSFETCLLARELIGVMKKNKNYKIIFEMN